METVMHPHHALPHVFWPLVVAAVVLEAGSYKLIQKRSYPWREMFARIGVHILHLRMRLLAALALTPIALLVWDHRIATIPLDTRWSLALLFLGERFAYYWADRGGHEIRWI
jgi:hypothetical protein